MGRAAPVQYRRHGLWHARAARIQRPRRRGRLAGICAEDFDLERIFHREGVGILHLSGLFAAMSPQTGEDMPEARRSRPRSRHEDQL